MAGKKKGAAATEPSEEAAPQGAAIRFKKIVSDAGGLYALDHEGRVFIYIDDDKTNEHGWLQLDFDDTRTHVNEDDKRPIKFVDIAGGSEGLYAIDEEGCVFTMDDEDEGWFQLDFDNEKALAQPPDDDDEE